MSVNSVLALRFLEVNNCSDHAHKAEFWYLLGVLFKINKIRNQKINPAEWTRAMLHRKLSGFFPALKLTLLTKYSLISMLFNDAGGWGGGGGFDANFRQN